MSGILAIGRYGETDLAALRGMGARELRDLDALRAMGEGARVAVRAVAYKGMRGSGPGKWRFCRGSS